MQIHEGLSEAQIVEFTKTEKKCKRKKDFYEWNHFAKSLIEADAKNWAVEIAKEQLKSERDFSYSREWLIKLISLDQITIAEKQIVLKGKKAKSHQDFKHLAESVCGNELLKNKYAHNFYEEAMNLAAEERDGKNTIALCSLAESALNEGLLNDKSCAKEILNKALTLTTEVCYMNSILEQANQIEDQEFMNEIINKTLEIKDFTIDDILDLIKYIKEPAQIQNLLEKAKETDSSYREFERLSDYFFGNGEIENALNCLKIGIQKICRSFEEDNLLLKLNELEEEGVQEVMQSFLEHIDSTSPKIDFSENMFVDYNPKWGRYLSIYLDFKDMAKNGNYSIFLDMEQRMVLGRRYYPGNYGLRWHGVSDTPTRVLNAFDRSLESYTGIITIKSADNLESFLKNESDHQWVQDQKLRNDKPKPRFKKTKWLWEVSCKNGELIDATKSMSEFCQAEDILKTVGDGKKIFHLRDYIFQNK